MPSGNGYWGPLMEMQSQKCTQARHGKQQKLIARVRVVFKMDCICLVLHPLLINHSQVWVAS